MAIVRFTQSASRYLEILSTQDAGAFKRINAALKQLEKEPTSADSSRLSIEVSDVPDKQFFAIRCVDYRVFYEYDENKEEVVVHDITRSDLLKYLFSNRKRSDT